MRGFLFVLTVALAFVSFGFADEPSTKPLVTGLKNPTAVALGNDGKVYVATMGESDKPGEGEIVAVQDGKVTPFAKGLDRPTAMVASNGMLFVVDQKRILRINKVGKVEVHADGTSNPAIFDSLAGIAVDEMGMLYVSDVKNTGSESGAIYRVNNTGRFTLVADAKRSPGLHASHLVMDGMSHLIFAEASTGNLHRLKIADGSITKLAATPGPITGIAWDWHGRLFLSNGKDGAIFVIPRPGEEPVRFASKLENPASVCTDGSGKSLVVPDLKAGTLNALPIIIPGQEIDDSPLPIQTAVAFPDLEWSGWKPENERGQIVPLRPLVLTHAGDGSNRVFVATEHGVIHVFPNDQKATKTTVFLDIQDRVVYRDDQNEEGFLGLAFHPNYKKTGEFFVFYTTKKDKLTNVVSRFRVSKDDPNRADPASEEELMRFKKPFWNHDGGTLCFGPDGYLYVAHGDGGAANDPYGNGQKLDSLLGKIHRIDVDNKADGKNYAIPKDNPFVDKADAKPEIFAYGLRNVWRMSFDRKTGVLWAADVGQNLYEEIDHIVKGGNYGWNLREGLHPFGAKGVGPQKDLIEPIWEYHHDVGKSMTGGHVYRGKRLPELEGHYLYADYVTSKHWALKYDSAKKRVVANHTIKDPNVPVMSFGEDEMGEVYFMTYSPSGRGIHWYERAKK